MSSSMYWVRSLTCCTSFVRNNSPNRDIMTLVWGTFWLSWEQQEQQRENRWSQIKLWLPRRKKYLKNSCWWDPSKLWICLSSCSMIFNCLKDCWGIFSQGRIQRVVNSIIRKFKVEFQESLRKDHNSLTQPNSLRRLLKFSRHQKSDMDSCCWVYQLQENQPFLISWQKPFLKCQIVSLIVSLKSIPKLSQIKRCMVSRVKYQMIGSLVCFQPCGKNATIGSQSSIFGSLVMGLWIQFGSKVWIPSLMIIRFLP